MSDEHFSLSPSVTPPPTEADYEAIFTAVMETVRGRWFLGEYAKRNRNADTELIVAAIERVESLWQERQTSPVDRVRLDLLEMAKAIAQTKVEIAAIKPDGDTKGSLSEATEELDSIVQTTERATSDILAAAEQVQEIAWTLRERGADSETCDALDQRATDIYSACSFQDLTGQRTRKVVEVMRFLEERIRAMIAIWGDGAQPPTIEAATASRRIGNGHAAGHLDQPDIDRMMPAPSRLEPGPPAIETPAGGHRNASHDGARYDGASHNGGASGQSPAAAEAVMAPAVMSPAVLATAVLGATAMVLQHAPIEIAREPERAPVQQPEPEPEPEPAPEPVAAEDEPRADPAALLNRILSIIRMPDEAPAAAPDEAPGETQPAAHQAVSSMLADLVTPLFPAPEATPEPDVIVEVTTVAISRIEPVVPEAPAEDKAAPAAIEEDPFDDILMPLTHPVSVAEAVDEMLMKVPIRVDVSTPPAAPALSIKAEPVAAAKPAATPAVRNEVAQAAPRPFVIEVPELEVQPEPEPAAPPEQVQAARPEYAAPLPEPEPEPEPELPPAETRASALPPEPPAVELLAPLPTIAAEPQQAAFVPVVTLEPALMHAPPLAPVVAVPEPTALPVRIAAARVAPPKPVALPRNEALAAITALSEEEKIALFS